MEQIFKIGDRVRIIAPPGNYRSSDQVCHWDGMDRLTGRTGTITEIFSTSYATDITNIYYFAEEWLEFADMPEEDEHIEFDEGLL